jgi:hypothetical protein
VAVNQSQPYSKRTVQELRAQQRKTAIKLLAAGATREEISRLDESARRTCRRFEKSDLPRWTKAVLVELIGTQFGWWIDTAAKNFERVFPAEILGTRRERRKALNIWIAIAYCWYSLCPAYNAPVWLFLYEFLSAFGLPLPANFDAANRARSRLLAEVNAIVEGTSRLSQGRRLQVLLSNPCILAVRLQFGRLPSRPSRADT